MEDPRHDMARELSLRFRRVDRAFKRSIEGRVRDTGVYRSQHRLLMHLSKNPNCSQVELSACLEVSPAAIAVSLKKLEKGGYIRREVHESDSRVHQVIITGKGRQVIEKSVLMFQEIETQMFDGFSEEEMKQLGSFMDRICKNLDPGEENL